MAALQLVSLLLVSPTAIGEFLIGAAGFVVAFGLAVFVHELGHFLAAKLFGVRVERFVIGFDKAVFPVMPKCIWERQLGETVYGVSIVPLGGYVKMVGSVHPEIQAAFDGEEAPTSGSMAESALQDQGALYGKPFYQKAIIYGAGVTMNMLLALVLVVVIGVRGYRQDLPLPPVVGWQAPDSPALAAGIAQGDRVAALNGRAIANGDDYADALSSLYGARSDGDDPVSGTLALVRGGTEFTVSFSYVPKELDPAAQAFETLISRPAHLAAVTPNGPADKAGLREGDRIVSVDGTPITDWFHLVHIVRASPDRTLRFGVNRAGELLEREVKVWESGDEEGVGQAGIVYGNPDRELVRHSLGEAVEQAPSLVLANTMRYVANLKRLGEKVLHLKAKAVHRDLSGPVGIAQVTSRAARRGLGEFLEIMVMLNIALAVMNILPIPVLDGGHIVFAAWEAVFRRPLPARIFIRVMEGAVMCFLAFFLIVTFSDVIKFF